MELVPVQIIQFTDNTGRIFEDKLRQGKGGNVINRDLENLQSRLKAWNQQTEAYTYWRERDHRAWNGRLAKPQRPETNISFNTPDIQNSIIQIIQCILGRKCILFTNMLAVYDC